MNKILNKITISKTGFFDDYLFSLERQSVFEKLGTPPIISEKFIETLKDVINILSENPDKLYYKLDYPERFYPNNMSQFFWEQVDRLMNRGVMFEVETSDLISVGFIPNTSITEHPVGWDTITIKPKNGEEFISDRKLYGCTLDKILTTIIF